MGVAGMVCAVLVEKVTGGGYVVGWWVALLIPGAMVCSVVGGLVLMWVLAAVEWLAFAWRACPRCGRRRWSWGYREGFGL
jgi:hypothetical protein